MVMFGGTYNGKKVLITGHTGFKGSWLALWLHKLGADVFGIALNDVSDPNHFQLLDFEMKSLCIDIRDYNAITKAIKDIKPEIVFHLAAQALVRLSYKEPVSTYTTNVLGTLNVLEACREVGSVRAFINITSDKCYDNIEQIWGYREYDRLGGYDMYSSSKACSEILTNSYRNSFFNELDYGITHNMIIASARAGNVVGGGDWACDRLVPDLMRAASIGQVVEIRSPSATRPWQHVLEPLSGYLLLGSELLKGNKAFGEAWNFGPSDSSNLSVKDLVELVKENWEDFEYVCSSNESYHEAVFLKLDCTKAIHALKWNPIWNIKKTIKKTTEWYRAFYENNVVRTEDDIDLYVYDAKQNGAVWTL
jgi:CDP-glucose 4,6-dehydratase